MGLGSLPRSWVFFGNGNYRQAGPLGLTKGLGFGLGASVRPRV
jgi:hypothetical protein